MIIENKIEYLINIWYLIKMKLGIDALIMKKLIVKIILLDNNKLRCANLVKELT
jgi:hypothetical protein